ncbi:MAG: hypothetical protein HKN92_03530 [Chitinophagales bacterium]|nr:hypothetical protein [Chitinophagales bacterium]
MIKISLKILTFLSFLFPIILSAQISNDNRTLFNVGGQDVSVSEFEYVYTKNNITGDADYSKESLDEYLKLYINFRLKVMEAEAMGLDTVSAINQELDGYRKQLSKSYLTDKTIFEQLVKQAYERMQKEIHVKHIMVQVEEDAFPQDTLLAHKRIVDIRDRLLKGEEFESVAKLFSDDKSVKSNGGDLGYLTVFQTVYPFENAMYNTEIGKISKPVRTQFGYHILTATAVRNSRGSVQIAQLLKKFPLDANETDKANVEQKAHELYKSIVGSGRTFEEAVKTHSDDNKTLHQGGLLSNPYTGTNWFETGQLFDEIEDVVFDLAVGEISKPVKTDIGWHILKVVDKRGLLPFQEVKNQLKVKVERDSRSRVAQEVMLSNIKQEYGFKEIKGSKTTMIEKIPETIITGEWKNDNPEMFSGLLFTFASKEYTQLQFVDYLMENLRRSRLTKKEDLLNIYYKRYVEEVCFEHEEAQLERKDPYFRALMKEYRDGILLFELTDEMVWTKAIKDTSGLKAFHENNRQKYMWKERAEVVKYECNDAETVKALRKIISKKTPSEIVAKINKKNEGAVTMRTAKYEKGQDEEVDRMNWAPGLSGDIINSNGTITVIHIRNILPAGPKELHEAKGYVVSDYQEYLEKQWIEELRDKYPVKINNDVLNSLINKR